MTERADRYTLTPLQEGLLLETELGGSPGLNLEQLVCRFAEPVSIDALGEAWRVVQARHGALRTSFELTDAGHLEQVVAPVGDCPLVVEEVGGTDADLAAWLAADRSRGVDLWDGVPMRLHLLSHGPEAATLVWSFHHALLDGRSFTVVLGELLDAYDDLAGGRPVREVPPAPSFRDHVAAVAVTDREAGRDHVARLLAGFDEPTPVPGAGTRQVGGGVHGEVVRVLPREVGDRLAARAAAAGATVGTAVLAAWAIVLARWVGRDDVVFGSTRSGRHLVPEAGSMVGCLITTVPVRARLTADDTVDDVLRALREQQLTSRPHEHLPLTDVQGASEVPNEARLLPTSVMFERGTVDERVREAGRSWPTRRFEVHEETSFPLSLAAYDGPGGLEVHVEHDTDLIDGPQASALAGHVATALTSIADSEPGTPIDRVEVLSPEERSLLVDGRNPSEVASTTDAPGVLERFGEWVSKELDRPAVHSLGEGTTTTYGELDQMAEGIARRLREAGAGPHSPVAICLPRSGRFVASVLGVLKAGTAFLPVDPTYPDPVRAHMLGDSAATLVILPDPTDPTDVAIERHDAPRGAELGSLGPGDPAYVIYTSGSTGAPKGVVVSHRSLGDHIASIERVFGLVPTDRVLQFTGLSFDVSIEELLPTLATGGLVALRSEDMAESVDALLDAVAAEGLTVLNLPSAFWHAVVEHLAQTGRRLPPSVRLVVAGGEKVSSSAYETWAAIEPDVRWLDGYGPTEATITCTTYEPAGCYPLGSGRDLPVGKPLAHARAYVLGPDGRWLVPDGQPGELWVGGSGVALGYLGRPELTAERFRPDPFVVDDGARMYGSGDLARWLPSGDLELLGRVDRQVKVRGFRLEPGEVESVLEHHPDVQQAFVSTRAGSHGVDRLVAWVVGSAAASGAVGTDEVLDHARRTLPAHAVPAAVVVLDELPLTPSGKVDVRALPAPPVAHPASGNASGRRDAAGHADEVGAISPRAPLLQGLFGEVLDATGSVGLDDSFFDLGGHSLLAVRLIGRIERELGIRISLGTLHSAPTPRTLASALDAFEADGLEHLQFEYLTPIQPEGAVAPLYAIHVLGTNAEFYRPLSEHLGPDQPVFGLSIARPGVDTPTDIAEVAGLYVADIERHQPTGPLSLAAVSLGSYVAFEAAQQLRANGRDVRSLVLFDAEGPAGRPQLDRAARTRLHLRMLRDRPVGHGRELAGRAWGLVADRVRAARIDRMRSRGEVPSPDLWMHRFVEANAEAADRYVAEPYGGHLVVIHAAGEVFDHPSWRQDALGWSGVAAGPLDVVEVPGRHLSMLAEPNVSALAEALAPVLDGSSGPR